eukprot:m.34797 g.34797  ORF g.34797 m.34797 type:complete len:320 (+) comp6557_c0_seq1:171-1130(+)
MVAFVDWLFFNLSQHALFGNEVYLFMASLCLFTMMYILSITLIVPWLFMDNCNNDTDKCNDSSQSKGGMREKFSVSKRVVGPIHCLPVGLLAVLALATFVSLQWNDGYINSKRDLVTDAGRKDLDHAIFLLKNVACVVSIAYMIVDTVVNILIKDGTTEIVVHHLFTIGAQAVYISLSEASSEKFHVPTAVLLATEITVPFLHVSYMLQRRGVDGRKGWGSIPHALFRLCSIGVLIVWIIFRFMSFLYMFFFEFIHFDKRIGPALLGNDGENDGELLFVWVVMVMLSLFIFALNIIWFKKLVVIATGIFNIPTKHKKLQ